MASRNYKYYQPNDKDLKDQYGDCVVRALTKVMSKTWMQVFDDLISYAKKIQCMPNGKQCYESYLKEMVLHIMESAIKRVQNVQLLIDLQKIIKVEYFF